MSVPPGGPERAGACPRCGAALTSGDVIIEYERAGDPAQYAECPDCRGVVHPA